MVVQSDDPSPAAGRTMRKSLISEISLPLSALGLLRATEAIAWTSIFPYVYPMIQSFPGVKDVDIPFYAGLMIAVFTFCEFLGAMLWAKLSDRIGRKTALLIGSVCGIITSLTLGLSRSLELAIASRAFGGLLNPNVALVDTCAVELAAESKEQRAKALSYVAFIRYMGNLIGPVIGGFFADPVALYPSLFPTDSVLARYPYLLPNLVVASLQGFSFLVASGLLPETHPQSSNRTSLSRQFWAAILSPLRKRVPQNRGRYDRIPGEQTGEQARATGTCDGESAQELQDLSADKGSSGDEHEEEPELKPKRKFTRQVILQILSVSLLAFHKVSSDAIIPTFLAAPSTPSDSQAAQRDILQTPGGFGYSKQTVGMILLSRAIVGLLAPATAVRLDDRLGPLTAYRVTLAIFPATYIFTPLLPRLPPALALVFVSLDLWIKTILTSVGYICSAVLIANVVHRKDHLSIINGVSASLTCLSRSVGPIVTGKVFAVGLEHGYAGIAFWTLAAVSLFGAFESIALKDHP